MFLSNIKKLREVLSLSTIIQIYSLYIGLIFLSLLEVIGIGTIPIILSEIIDPNLIKNYLKFDIDALFNKYLKFENTVIGLSIFLLVIFFLKSLYILFINYYELSILKKIRKTLSVNLIRSYILRPYTFFLRQNSSVLAKNVLQEVDYSTTYISSVFLILKEIQLLILILVLLLFVEPLITFGSFSFIILISILFYFSTDKKLKKVAVGRVKSLEDSYRASFEIFGAIKDIKVYERFHYFINKFKNAKVLFEKNIFISEYIKRLPRVFFELFSVLFIVSLIIAFYSMGRDILSVIPFISLIVVAVIRLLPSFSSLASAFTYIKVYRNSFDTVINEIYDSKANLYVSDKKIINVDNNLDNKKLISLENISFNYPGSQKGTKSISNIKLNINKGSMTGILGKSGSGKSTLINMILKLIEPDKGKVNFNLDVKKEKFLPISFVPQDIYLLDDSIRNNIAFGVDKKLIDDNKVIQCLKDSEMWDFVKNNPAGLDLLVGERGIRLSGGEKQRIGLARALYFSPEVLILDEATSSLDIPTERKIVNTIKKFKNRLTMIVVAHRLSTLQDCDTIHFIENGSIKDTGLLNDLLARNPNLN